MKIRHSVPLRLVAITFSAALLVLSLSGCSGTKRSTTSAAKTTTVSRGNISVTVHGSGTIQATSVQAVSNSTAGKVTQIFKEDGDTVKEDENIAEISQIGTNAKSYITAPTDGVVSLSQLEVGATVQAGMTVCNVQSASSFKAVINVDELDIANVKSGQKADVSVDALSGKTFSGTVDKISQTGVSANGVTTFNVTLSLADSSGLMDKMSTSADISTGDSQNTQLVPVEALTTEGSQRYLTVRTKSNNKNVDKKTAVTVGLISDTQAEIKSGVSEGATVVLPDLSPSNNSGLNGMGGGGQNSSNASSNTSSSASSSTSQATSSSAAGR